MPGVCTYDERADLFVLAFPFSQGMTKDLKRRVPGYLYNERTKQWTVPPTSAIPLLAFVDDHDMRMSPTVRRRMSERADHERSLTDLSRAHEYDGELAVLDDVPLRPYQRAAVSYVLRTRRCFVADEMGLGKTLSSIAAVHAAKAFPALVVCPAVVKLNWQREVTQWFPGTTAEVLNGQKPYRIPPADFVIINYDIVADWEDHLVGAFQSIILDESQYIRNSNARSLAVRHVARSVPTDGLRLALTGTPVWLQTKDLWHQLDALGRQDEFGGWPFFNRRYVRSKHAEELHERLRATCYVRRLKADVLTELPAKTRAPFNIDLPNHAKYKKAEDDVVRYLMDRAAQIAAELGGNPSAAAIRAKMRAEAAIHLVRIGTLKRLAAELKLPQAYQWIDDFLTTGKKLIVFAHHRTVIDAFVDRYKAGFLVGGMTATARQAAVDRFQEDPDAKVIVCALTSAGVGITLHAASDVYFHELGWTAAGHDQCEDRAHRLGQTDNVTAWYMLANGTIETENWDMLAARRAEMEAVADGAAPVSDRNMGVSLIMRMAGLGDDREDEATADSDLDLIESDEWEDAT